jgi:ATP-dependent helicase/nuclease subunit A
MSEVLARPSLDPQQLAADPQLSAFVTANAGSGKTKTLIDRVARLLLAGAEPAAILCVTYTKAAAAEMQRRLFDVLGEWSVMDGQALAAKLHALDGRRVEASDERALSEARRLFARALETPGGLKIQTIHAFCEKLLRRFPLEAGVSPAFRVIDDAAAAVIAAAAKAAVARHAMAGEGPVAEAYARLALLDFQSFEGMFRDFEARRSALAAFFAEQGGLPGAVDWTWHAVQLPWGSDPEALAREAMAALPRDLWRTAAEVLSQGTATDQKCARQLAAVAANPEAGLGEALAALFTQDGEGTPAAWVAKTSGLKSREGVRSELIEEQMRLENARAKVRGATVAWDTIHALTLAAAYLEAYRVEKAAFGALDFADLIEKTRALLAGRPAAAWVLYKLDGGIEHILVDEAQDTAPDQWAIVRALTGEFFSGASDRPRSLFVVGDEKQSIYSFQGAAPERLNAETEAYVAAIRAAGLQAEKAPLRVSWRSTREILAYVDAVFPGGVPPGVDPLKHEVAPPRAEHEGCVDLWPLQEEPQSPDRTAWTVPLDIEREDSANRTLAKTIACEIKALIARGDRVWDKEARDWRAAHAGDVLVLVRRRRALFEEILRALKHEGLPVAGADRLALSEHIVFDDLLALARFALFPTDELNLAALLKSPFCELDDDSLYRLAHGRGRENLWLRLQARAAEQADWAGAHAVLTTALAEAKARRPFEFYSRMLGLADGEGGSLRRRLLRRLGAEAQDALDEFLAQVLAAEGRGVHDLESLAADFASLDITVKREMEGARREVRVMTAHGAKGLEAPIVFLPETTITQSQRGSPLMETEDIPGLGGGFLWCASAKGDCEASKAARERRARREAEEGLRLLYVALTRARDRLVLCGRAPARGAPPWWTALAAALEHPEIAPKVRKTACGEMPILRYGPDPKPAEKDAAGETGAVPLPGWTAWPALADPLARYASPSDLGDGATVAAPSPLAQAGGLGRFRRGDLIHKLLQLLPDLPETERAAGATALLQRERDLTEGQRAEMTEAALSVLSDPRFAEVFGPGSRAEVAIAGSAAVLPAGLKVSGRIDRLVVLDERVLVADFKTNRPSPAAVEAADPAYLRQMAIYWAVLGEVFPGRRIEAAIVWTDGPKLMPIPENLIRQSLAGLGERD